jgi:cytoskeletal protein RodZ
MIDLGLASRRLKKQISLEQIATTTKIGVRTLRAIEAGEFQKLPGGIYNTSYIRQYAQAIDLDESEILTMYYSVMGIHPGQEEAAERLSDSGGNLVSRFLRHTSTVLGSL